MAGAIVLFMTNGQRVRAREGAMQSVQFGDQARRVTEILGVEHRTCPGDDLDHLGETFPDGWSQASIDVAIERLEEVTAERRVFGADSPPESCRAASGQTEVGVDSVGAVLWTVPVLGRNRIRLPPWLEPAGNDEPIESPRSARRVPEVLASRSLQRSEMGE